MDNEKKKQIKNDYKTKSLIGAVYAINCNKSEHRIVRSTTDIAGIKNRFQFSILTKSCPDPALRSEWTKFGSDSFSLEILEELKMKEDQTVKDFSDDIKVLFELWNEKLSCVK